MTAGTTMVKTTTNKLNNMSGYYCRNICVFSFRRNIVNNKADVPQLRASRGK